MLADFIPKQTNIARGSALLIIFRLRNILAGKDTFLPHIEKTESDLTDFSFLSSSLLPSYCCLSFVAVTQATRRKAQRYRIREKPFPVVILATRL